MKKMLFLVTLFVLVACGKNETVKIPDHKGQIDSNTARIELLELKDVVQDSRLDALEQADLDLAADIVINSNNLSSLNSQFNSFRVATNIRFFILNLQLGFVFNQIYNRLDSLESGLSLTQNEVDILKNDVDELKTELDNAKNDIQTLQNEVVRLDSEIVDVIYPCGSGEVLLKTRDGLVGYFQNYKTENIQITDSIIIPDQNIPQHFVCDKFFSGNGNNKRCEEGRNVPASLLPGGTYNVGDTASIEIIKDAYLSKLPDGNYRTTTSPSCNFSIVNGEVQ